MSVRAKFKLTEVTTHYWNGVAKTLRFDAMYDTSIPEEKRFRQDTPSGSFSMLCTNPAALAQFELGKSYYFDVTPAD